MKTVKKSDMPMLPYKTVIRLNTQVSIPRELNIDTLVMQDNAENIVRAASEKVFFFEDGGFYSRMLFDLG